MPNGNETEDARRAARIQQQAEQRVDDAELDLPILQRLLGQASALAEAAQALEVEADKLIVKSTVRGQALGPHMTNAVRAAKNVGVVMAALKVDADAALKAKV